MTHFIRVEKDGILKEESFNDINNLYKDCSLRKPEGFEIIKNYEINDKLYEIWGRINGRTNILNKYKFPNININIYGVCAIICKKNNEYLDLTLLDWNNYISNLSNIKLKDNLINNNVNNDDDNDDNESDSESEFDDYDLELKSEDYLYSSEEED